ncbi:MAG: hypothetical protein COB04_01360 [Gammaproteobacteria bacterium]|nr:MAG: hypothetical protein COB04_01360 [Gammaproteobacteria bacterium]
MHLLMKALIGLVVALAIVSGLLIATSNSQMVDVDLVLISFSSILGAVIAGAFSVGVLVGLAVVIIVMLLSSFKLGFKERELQTVRKELDNLRALGVKGFHE